MRRNAFPALLLALVLCGCAARTPVEPQTPPPAAETTPAAGCGFTVLPVQEESIHTLYGWEGYEVRKLTPYEGDWLVEYGYEGDSDFSLLAWVFGQTGRRVQLTALSQFTGYEITGPGQVHYTATGQNAVTPWNGLPQKATVRVLGDENSKLVPEWSDVETSYEPVWLDPAQPLFIGATEEGPVYAQRYEQLYDARIDADGLSFSFIPNGDSMEKFQSFFPAATSTPGFSTTYDPDSRTLTIRLYNTCLESGVLNSALNKNLNTMGYPENLYPYSFPAGSLGRDSHFLKDVTIREDGEDVVVSALLTDRAYRFTVETSNLGGDNIPSFRIVFREYNSDLDRG